MMKSVVRLILRHFSVLHSFVIRHSSFVILFIIAGGLASCKKPGLTNARIDPNGPVEVVIPEHGAYTGAFMDFGDEEDEDRKSTRLNSSHVAISYAVFCL